MSRIKKLCLLKSYDDISYKESRIVSNKFHDNEIRLSGGNSFQRLSVLFLNYEFFYQYNDIVMKFLPNILIKEFQIV